MVCPGTASGTSAPGVHADQNELRRPPQRVGVVGRSGSSHLSTTLKSLLLRMLLSLLVFSPAPLAQLFIYLFSLALEYYCVSVKRVELPGWRWESIHLSHGCCHLCGILMFFCFLYRPNLILLCGNFPPLVSQLIKFLLAAGVIFSRRFDQVEVSVAAVANPLLTLCPSRAYSTKAFRSQYLQSSKILAC